MWNRSLDAQRKKSQQKLSGKKTEKVHPGLGY